MSRSRSGLEAGSIKSTSHPYLCFHLFLLQLDEGHARKVHGVCGEKRGSSLSTPSSYPNAQLAEHSQKGIWGGFLPSPCKPLTFLLNLLLP